jgi:hypothetical protein
VQFTENIKYARLWDDESFPKNLQITITIILKNLKIITRKTTGYERVHLVKLKLLEL